MSTRRSAPASAAVAPAWRALRCCTVPSVLGGQARLHQGDVESAPKLLKAKRASIGRIAERPAADLHPRRQGLDRVVGNRPGQRAGPITALSPSATSASRTYRPAARPLMSSRKPSGA